MVNKNLKSVAVKKRHPAVAPPKVEVSVARKVSGEAPEQYHFILKDGRRLKSIQELSDALETMNDEVFFHHVNELKNDFASWVKDVFDEHSLADELKRTRNRVETRIKLLQKLVDNVVNEGRELKKK
jgi:hypothetical protein